MNLPNSSSIPALDPPPLTDNFYSPANFDFYSHQPYDSLDRCSNTIRLLKVIEDDSGQLQCSLTSGFPLAHAVGTYTAISYCAGDPKKTRSVQVDGRPFNAFANLAHAIEETYRYRRSKYGDVEALLWTDQICINQSNSRERSHQVGFMNKIYASAREVAVCLSTEQHRGDLALTWIKDDELFLSGWLDVLQLIKQPWWSRAWVFQEYVTARNATFLYGGRSLTRLVMSTVLLALAEDSFAMLDMIRTVHSVLESHRLKLEHSDGLAVRWAYLVTCIKRARFILGYLNAPSTTRQGDIIRLFTHSRNCEASDRRDHVYAFLGLADDLYDMRVDYSLESNPDVPFTELARRIIEKDGNLSILSHMHDPDDKRSATLPSWVPDWSARLWPTSYYEFFDEELDFAWQEDKADIRFLDNGTTLEISGIYVDSICRAAEFCFVSIKGYVVDSTKLVTGSGGDQLWILHGARGLSILRADGLSFKFISHVTVMNYPNSPWKRDWPTLRVQTPVRLRLT